MDARHGTWPAALLWATGCDTSSGTAKQSPAPKAKSPEVGHDHGHDHPTEGPHHGALTEWGDEEYHVEFTVDRKSQEATVYVLDGSAKKSQPIKADTLSLTLKLQPPITVTLTPKPQDGDAAGMSSRFVGKHDALGREQMFAGTISGQANGKPYAGDFKEEAHADHDHDAKAKK